MRAAWEIWSIIGLFVAIHDFNLISMAPDCLWMQQASRFGAKTWP
jgi:hypothetical protein